MAHALVHESPESLVRAMTIRAETIGDRPAVTFLQGTTRRTLTFLDLHRKALEIAGLLLESCAPGDRALLGLDGGLEYVTSFFGCIYARVVAVTSAPPKELRTHDRLARLLADSRASVILCNAATAPNLAPVLAEQQVQARLLQIDTAPGEPLARPLDGAPHDLMFLQYTSGSTSAPRGVMLSHASVAENLRAIVADTRPHGASVYVSWLPLYHDMGLVFMTLAPLYAGRPVYMMGAQEFLRHPGRWLTAISEFRGTFTAAPNFAFRLCRERLDPTTVSALDLSSMEFFVNGSEPVRVRDMESFHARLAPAGLRREAMYGAYGMAEVGVYVCCGGVLDRQTAFDREALESVGKVRPVARRDAEARLVAACGAVNPGHFDVRIVDPATGAEHRSGSTGEIWISGPSRGQGYWRQDDVSETVFRGRLDGRLPEYLRTGDVGFIHDGQLHVCGRVKEMMIVCGRNIFPADICEIVESLEPQMSGRRAAAFTVPGLLGEELVIVCAARVTDADWRRLADRIVGAVTELQGVSPSDVVFVKNRALKRTTSGKVQHSALREAYLDGSLRAEFALGYSGVGEHGRDAPLETAEAFETPAWLVDRICAHCRRICEAERVEPEHDLFELGLDSLRGVRLIEAIENEVIGRKASFELVDFVRMRTPKEIASAIARTPDGPSEPHSGHSYVEMVV